jgi:hypothetical protein
MHPDCSTGGQAPNNGWPSPAFPHCVPTPEYLAWEQRAVVPAGYPWPVEPALARVEAWRAWIGAAGPKDPEQEEAA